MEAIINKVRVACEKKGTTGVRKLVITFQSFGGNRDMKLTFEEFMKGLDDYETGLTPEEGKMFFDELDKDNSGYLSLVEFINMLRKPLSARCLEVVEKAFAKLDETGDGLITAEDLRKDYKASDGTSFDEFLAAYDGSDAKAGLFEVTREGFIEHYTKQRATIYTSDENLIAAVKSAWEL